MVGTVDTEEKKHNNIHGKDKVLENKPQVWSKAVIECNRSNAD